VSNVSARPDKKEIAAVAGRQGICRGQGDGRRGGGGYTKGQPRQLLTIYEQMSKRRRIVGHVRDFAWSNAIAHTYAAGRRGRESKARE
jgi:hypothetical protein